jgi:GntR family transcriptional repressor for pyruvate dehydrogenase complex
VEVRPIERSTLPDAIIQQFMDMIAQGTVKPGDRLPPERELGEKFRVGRTSVREAIKALASLGLIRRTREGTFVSEYSRNSIGGKLGYQFLLIQADIEEIFETRKLIEIGLARYAAQRATSEDVEGMREILDQDDGSVEAFIRVDREFHSALADSAQNRVLYELYCAVGDLLFRSHRYYQLLQESSAAEVKEITDAARRDHRVLLDAVAKSDADAAGNLMSEHLDVTSRALSELWRQRSAPGAS